jgi:hypothetical protein
VVEGTVRLARPPAGGPDAGTAAGHAEPAGVASTRRSRLVVRGRVRPASSAVAIRPLQPGRRATVRLVREGAFAVRVWRLRRGANRFAVVARSPGRVPWRAEILVLRR